MLKWIVCTFAGHKMDFLGNFNFWHDMKTRIKKDVYYCTHCHAPFVPEDNCAQQSLCPDDVKCFLINQEIKNRKKLLKRNY